MRDKDCVHGRKSISSRKDKVGVAQTCLLPGGREETVNEEKRRKMNPREMRIM